MHFDLADMRLMVRVAEHSSVTKGAERSHISVPAASVRIKNLEESIGAKLLHRGKPGITLTPAGEAFVRHARSVLGQIETLQGDMKDFVRGVKGRLRIGTSPGGLGEFLSLTLGRYLRCHPEVSIDLREQRDDDVIRAVAEGHVDIGIVAGATLTDDVEVILCREDRLALVVPADHRLASCVTTDFAETIDENFVGLIEAGGAGTPRSGFGELMDRPRRLRVEGGDPQVACRLIEAKVGVGVMSAALAARHAQYMAISVVPLSDSWARAWHKLCVRKAHVPQIQLQALLEAFRADNMIAERLSRGWRGAGTEVPEAKSRSVDEVSTS